MKIPKNDKHKEYARYAAHCLQMVTAAKRSSHHVFVDVARMQILRCAQIGVHGALAVGRHQHVTSPGRWAVGGVRGRDRHAGRANVVTERMTEPIGFELADERRPAAEAASSRSGLDRRGSGRRRSARAKTGAPDHERGQGRGRLRAFITTPQPAVAKNAKSPIAAAILNFQGGSPPNMVDCMEVTARFRGQRAAT
jgi:hypothetical protein